MSFNLAIKDCLIDQNQEMMIQEVEKTHKGAVSFAGFEPVREQKLLLIEVLLSDFPRGLFKPKLGRDFGDPEIGFQL